ncbi:MAG: CDP-glycerol:glycerophosphate glycerophosphotransferase [Actinomycetia bacterium]|nr:CDP-glycerol:glycerophosphate glycerophosphotransferase [Actinomycetes bacterium]
MSPEHVSLSVIVPVHGVQGYLRQCLDSILEPGYANLEVIAVDDRSPDGCGAILDEYAERDPRVRVFHLEQNVGLGEARNFGLDQATGEYVWFFDSDDYATEGAVQAILDRLTRTRPDVLIFDYARGYWHGKVQRSVINDLFRTPPPPEVFELSKRPSVLQLMMTAWNKAIRREFLVELGLRFSSGFYEDLNVTYPILMAAERLSLLDRTCYIYRQRRRGAITRTAGKKHFDAFAQYERVFAFMAAHPEAAQYKPLMFDRTIWHLLVILERGDRVTRKDEPAFFHEMSELYRKHIPAGHTPPDEGKLAAKYRLIERDAYSTFARLRRINAQRIAARRKVGAAKRRAVSLGAHLKRRGRALYYRLQRSRPIDPNLAVYAAYWYRGYACNPAAIYEAAQRLAPQIKGVWVVKPGARVPKGIPYVVAGSQECARVLARAKYFVNNVNFPDKVVKRKGTVHLQTQHGTPLKKMGLDQMDHPVGANDMDFRRLIERSDRWDFLISANPLMSEAWDREFPCSYEMLEIGYPRNDRFYRSSPEEVARLRAEIGVPRGKKAILYCPTHRDYLADFRPQFDLAAFMDRLGPDYVLLLRAHYYYKVAEPDWPSGKVIDVSEHPSVEALCLASDALLTDYSSIMFDYANLDDRPIVIFANDWDTYVLTRGVNFDITSFPPGVIATTEDELARAFTTGAAWGDAAVKHRADFRARFCPWDDGQAAERAVRRVFLSEKS